jgi:predicted ester cyclase
MRLVLITILLQATAQTMAFTLNPYNLYDAWFDNKVRNTLSMFHVNLSHGRYSANGPMVSFNMEWNRNGGFLLGRSNFVTNLASFNGPFHGLQAPDRYHVVDGNNGAVLYRLQGPQTGPFLGLPNKGHKLDIWGGELMQFDSEAKLYSLNSIEEFGIALEQLSGNETVTSFPPINLFDNPQTSPDFRQTLRDKMASLHTEFNSGNHATLASFATSQVAIDADQTKGVGGKAFTDLFTSDISAFPDKLYHADFMLADGHLGAIESVWEGTQTGVYTAMDGTQIKPTTQPVRVRSILFLEFNDDALITSATLVHDEAVVARQLLEKQSEVAYPLYP